jgi:predicted nuclease with TOPRIM domain
VDQAERTRLKTLANDAVIATFGHDNRESRLAEALERCVEVLEYHGDCNGPQPEPEGAILNLDTVQAIYGQLKERLLELEKVMALADEMVDLLKETLKDFKHDMKELGDEL